MRLMRRLLVAIAAMMLLGILGGHASAIQYFYDGAYHDYQGNIFQLKVDGKLLKPEMPPIVFDDYSVVPARSVFQDGLGAKVRWNSQTREVTVVLDEITLIMTIDKREARLNGAKVTMPIAPKIINDYTMIPARFVGEKLGMKVDFDSKTDTVIIDRQEEKVAVTKVTYQEKTETSHVITITTDTENPEYKAYALEEPIRIVVDVVDGKFSKLPAVIEGKGNLEKVRFGQQTDSARVVIDLIEDLGYTVRSKGKEIVITVTVDPEITAGIQDVFEFVTYGYEGARDFVRFDLEMGEPVMKGGQITVPIYGELPEEEAEKTVTGFFGKKMFYTPTDEGGIVTIALKNTDAEMYVQNNEIRLNSVHKALPRSVMLDAGHGGQDGGAVGYNEDGTIKALEKEFNLDVALRAKKLLESEGVDVHMIRTTDVYVDYLRVGSIANDAGTSLFVSIHTNSATMDTAHGIETFGYLDAGSVSNGMTSKRLSEILLEELIDETGAHDRGVKDGKSLAVINSTKMPATLVEIGFISNDEECELLMQETYRQKLAQAVCDGVLRAFEEMDI